MPAFLVYAGLEPLSFTNRFLRWTINEEAKQINLEVLLINNSYIFLYFTLSNNFMVIYIYSN